METMCVESKTICPILKDCKLGYFFFLFTERDWNPAFTMATIIIIVGAILFLM